jgi:hypothetical protein
MSLRQTALIPLIGLLAVTAVRAIDPGAPQSEVGNPKPDSLQILEKEAKEREEQAKADSIARADSLEGKKRYEYTSYPVLQILTLPLELLVVPAVRALIYPVKPPLRYFLDENVIDRTIDLISFGTNDQIMLYPTMNLAPGTGSSVGLSLRVNSLFDRPTERLVAMGTLYVNGDSKVRSYLTSSEMFGTGLGSKYTVSLTRVKNTSVNQPGTNAFWFYADSSNLASVSMSHLIIGQFGLKGTYVLRDNHFGEAPPQKDSIVSEFFRDPEGHLDADHLQFRGLSSDWYDNIFAIGVFRDTRNNPNIVLDGSDFAASWQYHLTDASHDFHFWDADWTKYFRLGKAKYEISREEERKFKGMSMKDILQEMDLETLRKQVFNRKVFILHAYAAQSFEVPNNHMPVYGLQTLGNDTPMRGYGGSRFRDYAVANVSTEYRFPVMRLVDGTIFNEYGVFGRSWDKIDFFGNLKNSWGLGIRVRRPDLYLFRLQLGFHGMHGIQLNLSVDEPY